MTSSTSIHYRQKASKSTITDGEHIVMVQEIKESLVGLLNFGEGPGVLIAARELFQQHRLSSGVTFELTIEDNEIGNIERVSNEEILPEEKDKKDITGKADFTVE